MMPLLNKNSGSTTNNEKWVGFAFSKNHKIFQRMIPIFWMFEKFIIDFIVFIDQFKPRKEITIGM